MRIAILGAGGVGGYLAARLADAGTADVSLIARGSHLEALRREGLHLRSVDGDAHVDLPAAEDGADIGPVDVVIFTVKSTDTVEAAASLPPLVAEETQVVSFQNGVDNERRIAEVVGADHVLGGVAFIFSTIAGPGVIEHTGGPARFVFGELDTPRPPVARALLDVLRGAGVDAELVDDIRRVLWRKFAFICAQAGMTALTRLPLGAIRDDPDAWAMYRRVIEEVCAVAGAVGVGLPADTVESSLELARGLDADSYSSLYHDLTHGAPMELEALNGTVVRLGRAHGVTVPMNEAIHAALSPWSGRPV